MAATVSIALATFNGARHLHEQLHSLRTQTRLPDEIVLSDDASTDQTLEVAGRFAREAPFPVIIHRAAANRGTTANFEHAIRACCGEIILLADQDDVWLPHKVASLVEALERQPEAGLAFSDAEVVDEQLKPLSYRLWEAIRFSLRDRSRFRSGAAFDVLLQRPRVTGATMAFRAKHRDRLLPIPEAWVHDEWMALILALAAPTVVIEEPLILYRQHGSQQIGGRRRSVFDQIRAARTLTPEGCAKVAERFESLLQRLESLGDVDELVLARVRDKITHYRKRSLIPPNRMRRLPHVLREACRGGYSRCGQGWKSLAQDLLLR